ncbi:hypothetical protein KCP76_00485 [Salmonella enterica subsp. enterica serovar Weltevreden]|nr:hypothetical protein KCP76_00485 [Salmonella enterica subsp. enterica serovar Weltevreden]
MLSLFILSRRGGKNRIKPQFRRVSNARGEESEGYSPTFHTQSNTQPPAMVVSRRQMNTTNTETI